MKNYGDAILCGNLCTSPPNCPHNCKNIFFVLVKRNQMLKFYCLIYISVWKNFAYWKARGKGKVIPYIKVTGCVSVCMYRRISPTAEKISFSLTVQGKF